MDIEELKKFGIDGPDGGIFIIVLCSKWCRSCKLFTTILEQIRDEGIIKLKIVDIGESSKLAQELKINAIPALIIFKDGKLLNKNIKLYGELIVNKGITIGSFNEEILKEIINQI